MIEKIVTGEFQTNTYVISNQGKCILVDPGLDFKRSAERIKEKYETTPDSNQFNYETLDLFLKYKVIDVKSVEKLMEKDKLKLLGVETLLEKYKGEK